MSYFGASVGPRPSEGCGDKAGGERDGARDSHAHRAESSPYFAARLSPLSPHSKGAGGPVGATAPPPLCPLCRGELVERGGLYHCEGRCKGRWVEDSPGYLLDVAALPFGVCGCCESPRPLVRGAVGAVCPASGMEYLLLPEGPVPREVAAPDGLCLCCAPPMPLVRQGGDEGGLVCRAKPHNRYELVDGRPELVASSSSPAETLDAIDAALRQNSARLTVNGLFDLG